MEKLGDWLLRAMIVAVPLFAYKLLSGISRHPDTPYFIRGLSRYAGIYVGRLHRWIKMSLDGVVFRPQLTDSLRKGLAAVSLFLIAAAVGDWPYNFYILLRFAVTGAVLLALLRTYPRREMFWSVALCAIALLFNPVAPFHFSKTTWIELNWFAAATLLILASVSLEAENKDVKPQA